MKNFFLILVLCGVFFTSFGQMVEQSQLIASSDDNMALVPTTNNAFQFPDLTDAEVAKINQQFENQDGKGTFTVVLTLYPASDSYCLNYGIHRVGVMASNGEIHYTDYQYGTWTYTFTFNAPLSGWLRGGLSTYSGGLCTGLIYDNPPLNDTWIAGQTAFVEINIP
jgi:hypothetical protein